MDGYSDTSTHYDTSDDERLFEEVEILRRRCEEEDLEISYGETVEQDQKIETPLQNPERERNNVLFLNNAIVSVLREFQRDVQDRILKNQAKQSEIVALLNSTKNPSNKPTEKYGILKVCGIPFFKALNGQSQPKNCETVRNEKAGHLSVTEFIGDVVGWTDETNKALITNVRNCMIEKKMQSFNEELKAETTDVKLETIRDKVSALRTNRDVVVEADAIDWWRVSFSIGNGTLFTERECEARWREFADTSFNTSPWETAESQNLQIMAKRNYFQNWPKIATELGTNRLPLVCFLKHNSLSRDHAPWTEEEDKKLTDLIERFSDGKEINWPKIYYFFDNRPKTQIRNHYYTAFAAEKKGRFTEQEDQALLNVFDSYGDMNLVKKILPHRSTSQLRRRYDKLLKGKNSFSPEEDQLLINAVVAHGEKWTIVAEAVAGRSAYEVRRRYTQLRNLTEDVLQKLGSTHGAAKSLLSTEATSFKIWSMLQIFWNRKAGPKRISYGVQIGENTSLPMKELLRMLEFGHDHLFGPRFAVPRKTPVKEEIYLRLSVIAAMLNTHCDFSIINAKGLPATMKKIENIADALHMEPVPRLPLAIDRCFIPPNCFTLLGHRYLLLAKNMLFGQSVVCVPPSSSTEDPDTSMERLSFAKAKDLFRSRMFSLFFLPALLGKISKSSKPEESVVRQKQKKVKSFTKVKIKRKMQMMSGIRWKKEAGSKPSESSDVSPPKKKAKKRNTREPPVEIFPRAKRKAKMIRVVAAEKTKKNKGGAFVISLDDVSD